MVTSLRLRSHWVWLALLVVAPLLSCVHWKPTSVQEVSTKDRVRVRVQSDQMADLVRPSIEGDSVLVGTAWATREATRIPLAEVMGIEYRTVNRGETLAAVALFLGTVVVVTLRYLPET